MAGHRLASHQWQAFQMVIYKIVETTNSNSKIVFEPLPQDDPTQRQPDISLAKAELGWEPKVLLDDGLVPTVKYFSDQL